MLLLQSISSLKKNNKRKQQKKSTRCVYLQGSSKVLEGSSPLICQNTNHSFIILKRLRYVLPLPDKSYSASTQLLCVSCWPLSVLVGTQLRLGEPPRARRNIHVRIGVELGEEGGAKEGKAWIKKGGKGCRTCGSKIRTWEWVSVGFTSFSLSFWPVQHSLFFSFSHSLRSFIYQGGEEGKTWDRKDMLSTGLMAMLSGPAIFMGMGVVIATGWAIFMGAEAGMLTEAMLTGPVMVTGCCRLTGDVMFTVLVLMFICAAMVTGWLLLLLLPRFIAVVMGAETVTGVAEAELQTSLLSEEGGGGNVNK